MKNMAASPAPKKYETVSGGDRRRELIMLSERKRKLTLIKRENKVIQLAGRIAGAITRKSKQRDLSEEEQLMLRTAYGIPSKIRVRGKIMATALDEVERHLGNMEARLTIIDVNYFKKPERAFLDAHGK
ncbi:MAG: hypothetical protein ABIG39_04055 [Candidatus Micrarchaeota archaeon]